MAETAERMMSDAEAMMWRLEHDPHLSANIAMVSLLDRIPDPDLIRQRLERATLLIPRLRQVVRRTPANLAPPSFEFDANFDLDSHIRRIALPAPGSERQLLDLASLIAADPLDAQRPLWQLTIVEGVNGDRAALILKLHHTITDGEGGIQLAIHLVDLERHAPPPPKPDDELLEAAEDSDERAADSFRSVLNHTLRIPLGITQQVRELLADPARIPDAGTAAAESLRGLVEQLTDTSPARSPLWTARSLRRRFHVGRAPLGDTKASTKRLGGTLNTAFVTLAAEAASRYHVELGSPVDSLRASMAVSTRTDESGANAFSLVRMVVPTGPMPLEDRFRAVQAAADESIGQAASGALEAVATLSTLLPTSIITRLARQQTQTIDFATSNVKGSPVPIYVGGAQILHNYPIGPLMGSAFNLTLLSSSDSLDMGLNIDAGAVDEPEMLARLLDGAIDDFVSLGR